MKRFIALILALVCLLSLVGCEMPEGNSDPTNDPGASNNGTGNGSGSGNGNGTSGPSQTVIPGGDDALNEDGTLNIPAPDADADCTVDASTWQTLLTEDAIRAALLENSLTTLTSDSARDQYQMYYCAGGHYGSILKGNIYSETVCGTQDGTVYVFTRSAADGTWTRTTTGSYNSYVESSYIDGPMQFLSGVADAYADARYVEADKAYVIENHQIPMGKDQFADGNLKIQFADTKLYSITLYINVNGETGALSIVFGSVPSFTLPTEFQSGNSDSTSNNTHPGLDEPPEAACSEKNWQRLFSADRVLDNLTDNNMTAVLTGGTQEYYYQLEHWNNHIILSAGSSYQEIILNSEERFERDSQNGQWTRYSGIEHHDEYDDILEEKTAILCQLLTPLENLYNETSFNSASSCFSLSEVSFTHSTLGSVKAEYHITIRGGMIEEITATIQADTGKWDLTIERDKSNEIELPTDYVDAPSNTGDGSERPSKK